MRRKRFPRKRRGTTKRIRGIPYIYKNRIYLGKKTTNWFWCSFSRYCTPIRKHRRRYWPLMVRKRYGWFINRKKPKRKKRKYKTQKGKGFGDPFKLLYSIGKQWRNNLR